MAKGHRSQIKRARNENNKETRPSAKLSYARISVQKACYVLDVIRGKDVQTALGILTYNPRYASSVLKKLLESAIANAEKQQRYERRESLHCRVLCKQRTYNEAYPAKSTGPCLQN